MFLILVVLSSFKDLWKCWIDAHQCLRANISKCWNAIRFMLSMLKHTKPQSSYLREIQCTCRSLHVSLCLEKVRHRICSKLMLISFYHTRTKQWNVTSFFNEKYLKWTPDLNINHICSQFCLFILITWTKSRGK